MADKNTKTEPQAEAKKIDAEKQKIIDAKKRVRIEAKKRVLEYLSQFDLTKPEEKQLVDDIKVFVGGGGQKVARVATKSINSALRDAFLAAGDKGLSEMDVFKQFKIGRPEMVTKIRILVLCPNPDDRVWVNFDESKETYFVVGKGANPPKGWGGYVPGKKEEL
jgi:hypothetical protein